MGKSVLVLGESGSGKSTSIEGLDPTKTTVFSALGKGLPFAKSRKHYTVWNKDTNPSGNLILTSSSKAIAQWLQHINKNMLHVTTVVVDDNTFLSSKELDRRRDETGFVKFNDIAHDFLVLSEIANTLREDLNVYFMHHVQTEGDGILENKTFKAMSSGKMINEKLGSVEAQFEIVLFACKMDGDGEEILYKFKTRDKYSTAKTPKGMFTEQYIDNDLSIVNKAIKCFYNDDCEEEVVKVINNKSK
jgi:energy-coupling factor transporter ATP-binding protein EcfA2